MSEQLKLKNELEAMAKIAVKTAVSMQKAIKELKSKPPITAEQLEEAYKRITGIHLYEWLKETFRQMAEELNGRYR